MPKFDKLEDMHRGWFIGDFEPSIYRTDGFEVGVLTHPKGEEWPAHYHKEAIEINVLIEGRMKIAGRIIEPGDIFTFLPYDIAVPEFLEDCKIVCVKTPSIPTDKYVV